MEQKTKEQIEKLLRDNSVLILNKDDALRTLEFVSELIEIAFEDTERNEPYATRYIERGKETFYFVRNLDDDLLKEYYEDKEKLL